MSYTNGPVVSSGNLYGQSISTSSYYYIQCDGDTIRMSLSRTPASSGDTGYSGEICWDANYLYVCISSNTWKRVALNTF